MDLAQRREERRPGDLFATLRRAHCLKRSGRVEEAVGLLRRLSPANQEARDALAGLSRATWVSPSPPAGILGQAISGYMPGGLPDSRVTRWSVPLGPFGDPGPLRRQATLVATEVAVAAVLANCGLLVVDRTTGLPLWELPGRFIGCWLHPRARPQALVTVSLHQGRVALVAHSLYTGAELGATTGLDPGYSFCGYSPQGLIVLHTRRRLLMSVEELPGRPGALGDVLWTGRPLGLRHAPVICSDRVLVDTYHEGLVCLDMAGRVLWREPGQVSGARSLGDAFGFVTTRRKQEQRLVSLSPDGETLWSTPLEDMGSVLAISPMHVLAAWDCSPFESDYALFDRETGRRLARARRVGSLLDFGLWGDAAILVTRPWLDDPGDWGGDDSDGDGDSDGDDPSTSVFILNPSGNSTLTLDLPGGPPECLAPLAESLFVVTDTALSALEPTPHS